jgi:CheY-like chemotaxis protein
MARLRRGAVSTEHGPCSFWILIVDENEPERRMLSDLLETAGYQLSEASSGKEASNCWRRIHQSFWLPKS